MRTAQQEWLDAVAQQSELLWQCGAATATPEFVTVPPRYSRDGMDVKFAFAVHCYLQELWENWGAP